MRLFNKLSITKKLYISNIAIITLMAFVAGLLSMQHSIRIRENDIDSTLLSMANVISKREDVKYSILNKEYNPELQRELNYLADSNESIDVIVICDSDSIRLYHNDESKIGLKFVGGDEGDILKGSTPYLSEAEGSLGLQRRAFSAVLNDNGEVIGFILVSVLSSSLNSIRTSTIISFAFLLVIFIIIAIFVSVIYTQKLKKLFFGYKPEEFRELHLDSEEVFNSLEEGIVAINTTGQILLINKSAKKIFRLSQNESYYHAYLKDLYPETLLDKTIVSGVTDYNVSLKIHENNILATRMPIFHNEQIIGALAVFRDKTEVTRLAEKLTGANYMLDTFRAFNHEFMNKLHIILGLIEMGQIEEAKEYIEDSSQISSDIVSKISKLVPIKSLAALLIGKSIRAKELGINIVIRSDSYFKDKEFLGSDDYVTIVGNLVENAMYELNHSDKVIKEIELGFYSGENHTLILCQDTGNGISEDILDNICDPHVSTKGEGHGEGLFLIKQIVDEHGGQINIETKKNEGTCFEISFPM